jgi:hypothetical protein
VLIRNLASVSSAPLLAEIDDGDRAVEMSVLIGAAFVSFIRLARTKNMVKDIAPGKSTVCTPTALLDRRPPVVDQWLQMLKLAVTSGSSIQDCEEQEHDWRELIQVRACLDCRVAADQYCWQSFRASLKKQQAAAGGSGAGSSGAGPADKKGQGNKENDNPAESKSGKVRS